MSEQEMREAVKAAVREQYGRHPIVHAADGGCTRCPLGVDDPIHHLKIGDKVTVGGMTFVKLGDDPFGEIWPT